MSIRIVPTSVVEERKYETVLLFRDHNWAGRLAVLLWKFGSVIHNLVLLIVRCQYGVTIPLVPRSVVGERKRELGADAVILIRYGTVGVSVFSWGSLSGQGRAIYFVQ